ncbi:hypothetical protein XENTR_v10004889 [Xenopus tropicalis]|uniref:Interferon gamma receptor 2 n=1 Tax=Xenopus tropicalis TaxID=8364 RepID=A0A7D9NLT3_XENTR|eukprot:XP_004912198.1 PREDICTED: interferon gamma receptor 2-like [Xenopus tropicalis]
MGTSYSPAALLLLLILLLLRSDAISVLPAPRNVRIDSYNLQHKLLWDPIESENVTYTVQYMGNYIGEDEYNDICENLTETVCNFTDEINFELKVILRVRAELGPLHSSWSETSEFQAMNHTKISPVKSLTVSSREAEHNSLYVSFESPLQPEIIPQKGKMKYLLQYWKKGSAAKTNLSTNGTFRKMTDLEASAEYCVSVTALLMGPHYSLTGETSHIVCAQTPATPGLTADKVIFLSVGLLLGCCIFLGFSYTFFRQRRLIKMWLYPPYSIPPDIEQYLQDPPLNGYPNESKDMDLAEVQYDHISIVESES